MIKSSHPTKIIGTIKKKKYDVQISTKLIPGEAMLYVDVRRIANGRPGKPVCFGVKSLDIFISLLQQARAEITGERESF